ncbi:DNA-binding transcription factor yap1 [Elasticomyces elasticus]|nr:DNA-binding transcription factor yap1 [Elasticomyces elasticus]
MVLYPSADELRQREQQHQLQAGVSNSTSQSQRMTGQQQQSADQNTPYLSNTQQDLLLAALNAQAKDRQNTISNPGLINRSTSDPQTQQANMSNGSLFMSPQDAELDNYNGDYTPDLDYLDGENNFDFDNADLGGEMIGALPRSNSEQTEDYEDGADGHDKRKSIGERDDDDEADPKRHEGEKGAKKPGRKPLTSEPTTKRKAQNRAAQRAFRERKEKHLKDLETKVTAMNKSHEADKHENGMLKAQVERLQVELREYRKRLSLNSASSTTAKGSPPLNAYTGTGRSNSGPGGNTGNFQFDFPKFGALPGSQIFGNQQSPANGVLQRGSITPPLTKAPASHGPVSGIIGGLGEMTSQIPAQVQRTNSQGSQKGRTLSPKTTTPAATNAPTPPQMTNNFPSVGYSSTNNMHGFASTLPQMGGDNMFSDLFSPSLLKNANFETNNNNGYFNATQQPSSATMSAKNSIDASTGGESTAGLNRVFQFNGSSSASDSASPSNSSTSQWNANGPNSSCGTSPEPSHGSPADKAQNSTDSYIAEKSNTMQSFGDSSQLFNNQQQFATGWGNNGLTGSSNVDFTAPSGAFDPVLFGDYRDTNDATYNSTDFTGGNGFFDEALNSAPFDYGSPSNLFGILQQSPEQTQVSLNANVSAPPSKSLMAEIEKTRNGGDDDYGLPGSSSKPVVTANQSGKLISCNNIWYASSPPHEHASANGIIRNQLQSNPDFQAGTFDLDNLCSELRAKARCSESGVMVSQDHVDAALKKLAKKDDKGKFFMGADTNIPPLMFEQESWDNVLAKLSNGSFAQ